MELRHLRYFLAVADRLNFTEAARALGIAQPPLSVQIRNLETELGAALFTRRNRRVLLTPAGSRFLEEARAIVTRADRAVLQMQDEVAGRMGEITIEYTACALSDAVTRRLRKFLRKHPGMRLVTARVESGAAPQADALIAEYLTDTLPAGAVILEQTKPQVAVPPKHRLAARLDFVPADLIGENVICSPFDRRSAAEHAILRRCDTDRLKMTPETCSASLQDRFWRVSLGLGVTFCTAADRGSLDAHRIPLAEPSPDIVTAFVPNPQSRAAALPILADAIRA